MHNLMPPTNPRKRAAPGASPKPQTTQTYPPAASPMQNPEYRGWAPGAENSNGNSNGTGNNNNTSFADPSAAYNMNVYNGNNLAQVPDPSFELTSAQLSSTQLARRPVVNRQMVATAPKYENGVETWGQYLDDSMGDPLVVNGPLEESDNIELLEERAAVAKRDAQSKRKQIPPFVQKLSSFLEESRNTELIRWSERGDSFVVLDEDEFAKTLIPELFKHNNYASFVRQLNMYGFHKRVGLSDNSMKASERKNKSPSEYYNPYFKRGHPSLLWLINKPKGGATKGTKKTRPKDAENQERDSDEDGQDIEEVYGNNVPRALSAAPEPGSLQRRDVAVIQNQLMEIQKQQGAITNAISRLRKDHNQLYQQSMAFQTLHDRHENSINAILTFLATVYNRSLDGQGAQNIAQMFQNGIPPEQQQGSVVDVTGQQEPPNTGSLSPHRRQQRLLMAPPNEARSRVLESPTPASTPQPQTYQNQQATIEELFDTPLDSPVPTPEPSHPNTSSHSRTHSQQPQNMMNIINSTNAQTRPNSHNIQFPDMLSHYENAHNRTSLTENERNSLLTNIMNVTSPPNTSPNSGERVDSRNNALISPSPPQQPTFHDLNLTQAEIDELVRLQKEQDSRIENIRGIVEPLSPSGSIPGLDGNGGGGDGGYFTAADFGDHGEHLGFGEGDMDMEQFLDGDAFYGGNGSGVGNGGGNSSPGVDFGGGFEGFGNGGIGNGGFDELGIVDGGDTGMEGDLSGGVGGGGGSGEGLGRSPSKKRRKN